MAPGSNPLTLLLLAQRLKTTERRGWIAAHPPRVESVADHTFGVALAAWTLGGHLGLDRDAMVSMALVHDLAEALTGDVIPSDKVDRGVRKRREEEALAIMCADLDPRQARTLLELWRRFEFGDDPEANLLREIDKLDVALQANAYEGQGVDPSALQPLRAYVEREVSHPLLRQLLQSLRHP